MTLQHSLIVKKLQNMFSNAFMLKNTDGQLYTPKVLEQLKASDETAITFFIGSYELKDYKEGKTYISGKGEVGILQNVRISFSADVKYGVFKKDDETQIRLGREWEARIFGVKEGYAIKAVNSFTFDLFIDDAEADDIAEVLGVVNENNNDYEIAIKKEE
jgi:hypothetical protein